MKLINLLNHKKDLTNRVGYYATKLRIENSVIKGNTRSIDPKVAFEELKKVLDDLYKAKVAIAKANIDAYALIYEFDMLSEQKRILSQIKTMDGKKTIGNEVIELEACLKQADVDNLITDINKKLKNISEKLTEYNSIKVTEYEDNRDSR